MPCPANRQRLVLPAVLVLCGALSLCAAAAVAGALRQDFALVSLSLVGCSAAVAALYILGRLADRLVDGAVLGALRACPRLAESELARRLNTRPASIRLSLRRLQLADRVTAETDAHSTVRYCAS